VSSALKKVNGVIKAEADYKKHTVKVIFNDSTVKSKTLKKKIESLGFKVVK
jgi:copper chaperone CopZ